MMSPLRIDWHEPFSKVSPFLAGSGGLVLVRAGDLNSSDVFLKILRAHIKSEHGITIQFDPNFETTRTPAGLIATLSGKLGHKRDEQLHRDGISVNIGTEISAGRDASIINPSVTIHAASPTGAVPIELLKDLAVAARKVIATKRLAIFIPNLQSYPKSTRDWLWEELWEDHLAPLIKYGLVLFLRTLPGETTGLLQGEISIDCVIDVPDVYRNGDRQQAERDLALIFQTEGIAATYEVACRDAKMFLATLGYRAAAANDALLGTISSRRTNA